MLSFENYLGVAKKVLTKKNQKIDIVFDECTPESQTGGVKITETIEHLSLLKSALLEKLTKGKGIIYYTFAEIEKCFDNIFLSYSNSFLIINPKALKVLTLLLWYQQN